MLTQQIDLHFDLQGVLTQQIDLQFVQAQQIDLHVYFQFVLTQQIDLHFDLQGVLTQQIDLHFDLQDVLTQQTFSHCRETWNVTTVRTIAKITYVHCITYSAKISHGANFRVFRRQIGCSENKNCEI